MTLVFEASGRSASVSRGSTLRISSRATLTTLSAVIGSSRAWSALRMRWRHRHAEIGADERFFQFIPIHRSPGELSG